MAVPKKLPSGRWRVQVYDYTDSSGKKHYKSITADTKKEAAKQASSYAAEREPPQHRNEPGSLSEAVTLYITVKRGVLSPSTVCGYESLQKNYIDGRIGELPVKNITNETLQYWISSLAAQVSPKTVRNAYALLTSTLKMFRPSYVPAVTLPQPVRPDLYVPTDDDVRRLIAHISGTELEVAVLLAAFGPMRRGEICALCADDVDGSTVSVTKSMVLGDDGIYHVKQPKTYSSYRRIVFPDFVAEKIRALGKSKGERIIEATPNQISNRFGRALKFAGLPHFRFHDLRHYSASIMHAIGIPDQYIIARGGWATDNVMKTVYRGTMDDKTIEFDGVAFRHFREVLPEED